MTEELATTPVPAHLFDGYTVHRAALAYGLNVFALPRQVLLAGPTAPVPAAVSFTHGVPEASTVAAVTFAQDRRLRRALVERAGLPVPRGATFSFRSSERAAEWSAELEFPVVVKETVGENPAKSVPGVASRDELEAAFRTLRRRDPIDRSPGSNPMIAGYAATRLGYEVDDEGNQVAPARTRFLVEKQPIGQYVRLFACGNRSPIAVLLDPGSGQGTQDVSDEVHSSVRDVALRAMRSIPGLAVASVDVVLDDHRVSADEQPFSVVEVSERIRSETYEAAATGLGERLGEELLEFQAATAGLELSKVSTKVNVTMRIAGLRDAGGVVAGLSDAAAEYGVEATVTGVDALDEHIDASCQGTAGGVAMLAEALMSGLTLDERASCIETHHQSA